MEIDSCYLRCETKCFYSDLLNMTPINHVIEMLGFSIFDGWVYCVKYKHSIGKY